MAPPAHVLSLTIDGVDATLRVVGLELVERLHAPFRATLTCFAVDDAGVRAPLVLDELIGQKAELVFLHDTTPRTIVALVEGATEAGLDYELVLAPRLALCADRVDYRVFVEETPLDAVKAVLGDAGVSFDDRVSAPPAKRPQIVQAFESDLAFVTRLCAEEGIALVAETADGTDRVVLGDGASPPPLPGGDELAFGAGDVAGLAAAVESVYDVHLERAVVTDKVTLRDYDFERPLLDQTVTSGSGPLEDYEYPAGYLAPGVGKTLADRRLEEKRQPGHVLRARSSCRRLAVGYSFKLDGAPRDDLLGPWLVVAVTHRASDFTDAGVLGPDGGARRFEAELVAVPAGVAPRPPRPRAPTVGGIEHATVTGAAGSEIHPDKYGRVKALLRWDRRGKADDTASAWLRPLQPPTSGGFFLPRVGWEVMLAYSGTSADQPYELGRLYNGAARPPEDLPGQKVRTSFGSLTTPGGGSANMLRMDDAAGKECMLLVASKDLNERTENDKGTSVKGDDIVDVGANHTNIVGIQKSLMVTAAQTTTVGGSRDWSMVGALKLSAGSESISVGGLRLVQVGGDYETSAASMARVVAGAKAELAIQEVNRHVTGGTAITVGGSWKEIGGLTSSESVLGAKSLVVAGAMSIKAADYSLAASVLKETYASRKVTAGGKRVEAYGGAAKYKVGGAFSVKGAKVHVKAKSKIVLDGAGAKITITSGKVVVDAAFDVSAVSVVTGNYAAK